MLTDMTSNEPPPQDPYDSANNLPSYGSAPPPPQGGYPPPPPGAYPPPVPAGATPATAKPAAK